LPLQRSSSGRIKLLVQVVAKSGDLSFGGSGLTTRDDNQDNRWTASRWRDIDTTVERPE
jgi:hypothetical protein